jgi:hypothetical protein
MEASFYPPRHTFNVNNYDDNLKQQHEGLKRIMNIYENIYDIQEEITEIEKAPIKQKRRSKKDITKPET